jgi:hypothetical protein
VLVLFLHDLNPELEFQKVAVLDIVPHVATIEVRIPAPQLLRFVPDQRTGAGQRLPVELDEARLALLVDQPEGVHAEAFHVAVMAREGAVGHGPQHHM